MDRPRVRSPRPWSRRLTCPSVRASSSSSPAGLTWPRQRSFEPGHQPGVRPVIRDHRLEEAAIASRFPAAFRPPAFASRPSCSRRGVGPTSRSAYRTSARTSTGLPRSARTSCDRGGRPLYPEDGGAHPDRGACSAGACRSAAASPCTPPEPPTGGDRFTRHQRGFTRFARPVFPSPAGARMERAATWASPGLRTPPTRSRRRTPRWGQAIEHGPGTTLYDISRTSNPACSLVSCDLASHRALR